MYVLVLCTSKAHTAQLPFPLSPTPRHRESERKGAGLLFYLALHRAISVSEHIARDPNAIGKVQGSYLYQIVLS
jgi:hypothetical protein